MRQQGFVLPLLLLLVALSVLAAGIDGDRIGMALASARSTTTRSSLATVADALLGSASAYREAHASMPRYGLLPCPDLDGDGSSETCGASGLWSIGHLPYRTLGIAPPEDGSGNCIWYAVAGDYKNNPSTSAPFNWDSRGQFEIADAGGNLIVDGAQPRQRAIAVLVAAGPPLPGQARPASTAACRSAAGAAVAPAYLESLGSAAPDEMLRFTQGTPAGDPNNDIVAWLTVDDLYRRLLRASYFEDFLNRRLDDVKADLGALPAPAAPEAENGTLALATLPSAAELGIGDPVRRIEHDDWRPMYRYLRCKEVAGAVPPCLQLNGLACRALVVFGGGATPGQAREDGALAQYLEEPALSAVGTLSPVHSGPLAIDLELPTQDVYGCIA